MSVPLRNRWTRRLEAAEYDPSWKAYMERRVLKFLLTHYSGANSEASLQPFPFFRGESPPGRERVSLTHRQLRYRLERIARVATKARLTPTFIEYWFFGYRPIPDNSPKIEDRVAQTIVELEEFVATQLEQEAEVQYQDKVRERRRW